MYEEGQYVILKRNISDDIGVPRKFFEECYGKAYKLFETPRGGFVMVNGYFVKEQHIDKVVTPEEYPEYFI
jgi:hypothetical protein